MNFTIAIDIAMMVMSLAVLVQCARMMRRLKAMRDSSMQEMVAAIDRSTAEARVVLDGLKSALASDMRKCNEIIAEGTAMREELDVMTGIANTVAERILETVRAANAQMHAHVAPEDYSVDEQPHNEPRWAGEEPIR